MHEGLLLVALVGGLVLHGLNAYWGWLILQKARGRWRAEDGMGADAAEGHRKLASAASRSGLKQE